jgi:proton-dependent oligopeptide transporter, POT family
VSNDSSTLVGLRATSDFTQDTNYIQQALPAGSTTGAGGANGQSGALGMGQRASTGITTFNTFWQYLMPLLGAWVADAHWGRYKTISVALGIDIIGHIIVVISAIPPVITTQHGSLACLIIAILVIGFGTGGFKPNINPLIVEQIPTKHMQVITLESGERVIVDPAITISRVYNWFYLFINVGSLIGQLTMVYAEKYVGFYLAFLLPTCLLCLCPLVMWSGRKIYEKRPATGSVLGKAFRTWILAMKGRWSLNPWTTWKRLHSGDFWDSVKPSKLGERRPKWMTFDDAFVDELRRGFSACAVFCWYPIYWLTYSQRKPTQTRRPRVL